MGKRILKRYNKDFKLRAVKLCHESGKHDAEIARDLGVHKPSYPPININI
jgi:transposase-like protein